MSNNHSLIRLKSNLMLGITGSEIPFEEDGDYRTYLTTTFERRRGILKKQARMVSIGIPHDEYLQREHLAFLDKIEKDVTLNKNKWRYEVMDKVAAEDSQTFLGQKMILARDDRLAYKQLEEREILEKIEKINLRSLHLYLNQYVPPNDRILITKNITFNALSPIPVFCDISKTLANLKIPESTSLTFNYIDSNFVNSKVEKDLAKAVTMAQESKNQIKCECHAKKLDCYENPECPCFKMNYKMQMLQLGSNFDRHSKFRSLDPILFTYPYSVGYLNLGFACSDLCDCGGKCHNNSMMIPEMNLFPLEVYRSDSIMGFMVRSTVFVPAGTPVMEFVGEIREEKHLTIDHKDYALMFNFNDDTNWRKLLRKTNFKPEYKKCLLGLSSVEFYVDPTLHGNVGRMAAHSCCPNMEVVKVYRKSLSPAHASLIMVTIEDVYPGTPLSFDYGPDYDDVVRTCCRCATFACCRNGITDQFKSLDHINLSRAIKELHELRNNAFKRDVLDPIGKMN